MRLASLALLVPMALPAASAYADSVTTYNVTDAPGLSGTVTVDSTVGTITTSDITVVTSLFTDELTGGGGSQDGRTGFSLLYVTNNDAYELILTSPNFDGTLKGFTGGGFLLSDGLGVASTFGELVAAPPPATITPEPSSIALLGTGLLGFAGRLRKRFV